MEAVSALFAALKNSALFGVALSVTCAARAAPDVAVAWNDDSTQRGVVRGMSSRSPWLFETPPIEIGRDVVLRFARGTLYAVSRAEGTISAVNPDSWTVTRSYMLGPASQPEDIAVVSADVAYVTRAAATHLLRLDLSSGAAKDVVDLSILADADGVPDLGMMAVFNGRLFVQVRRLASGLAPIPPALLAVVDVATDELVDVDPNTPGMQAIELSGTAPKMKMHVLPASRRLFVSATGVFHDDGGIEAIDLDTLESLGLFIRELGPGTGPEIGAFVMTRTKSGYLIFSTDLLSSSHLKGFSLGGGVDPSPDLHTSLEYFVPALVHDPRTDALFLPVRGDGFAGGVHVYDAGTSARLTREPAPTGGPPTDLELLCDDLTVCSPPATARFLRADTNADGIADISDSLYTIGYVFFGRPAPPCRASADSNGDGKLDMADPIFLISHLFRRGLPPPAPFPDCGDDRSAGDLDCRDYDSCSSTPAPSASSGGAGARH